MAARRDVALLIETSRSYGRALLRGVKRFAAESDSWSVFADLRSLDSPPPPWLGDWDGDGVLTRTGNAAMSRAVRRLRMPHVELRSARHNPDAPFVGVDNAALVRGVVTHFLDRGFRNFGVYALRSEDYFAERSDRFVRELSDRGFACEVLQQGRRERPAEWASQQRRLAEWVRSLPTPCGVLACTDRLGFWLLDACRRAGVGVPEEVAVVGVENDETLCDLADPPLSSVPLGGEAVGHRAAGVLSRLMSGRAAPKRSILLPPPPVVERRSSSTVAVEDPDAAAVLRLIRDRATGGLCVGDLVAATGVSRSRIERLLKEAVGRTPGAEIARVRLEAARRLLRETDLSVAEVASRSGFPHPQHFSEAFKKAEGVPPGRWRRVRP